MSYEQDALFVQRITAGLRQLAVCPPVSLGTHGATLPHGTTIGAFLVDEGQHAVAFSDGKVSMANRPVHMAYRKILSVDSHTRMLISGSPSLGFEIASALKTWIGYREDTSGQPVSARAKVRFLARLLLQNLGLMHAGILVAPILVTYDSREKKRARVFTMGADGSEVESEEFVATSGSGTNIDIWFRDKWNRSLSIDEGIALAREAISRVAPEIDSFSGGKVSIDVVGPAGARTIA